MPIDYQEERIRNIRDLNLIHVEGEVWEYNGVLVDMRCSGKEQLQIMRHIAFQLTERIKMVEKWREVEKDLK